MTEGMAHPPADGHAGDLVSAHLDGELDAETEAWVRTHLEACDRCRAMAQEAATARSWVRALPVVDSTPVVEGLLARHRTLIRVGAAFVGLAAVVLGSLALTSAVIRPDVVPEIDDLVAAHVAATSAAASDTTAGADPWRMANLHGMERAHRVDSVGRPYSAPPAMIGNRARLSRRVVYDGRDLTLVVYSDGATSVSVFQQPGRLDWSGLPSGTVEQVGTRTVWDRPGTSPTVMVTELGHLVVTVIAPDRNSALTVIDGLAETRRGSVWDHIHDACSRFTDVFAIDG